MHIDQITLLQGRLKSLKITQRDIKRILGERHNPAIIKRGNVGVTVDENTAKLFLRIMRDKAEHDIIIIKERFRVAGIEIEEIKEEDVQEEGE